jgi:hypothetical protein
MLLPTNTHHLITNSLTTSDNATSIFEQSAHQCLLIMVCELVKLNAKFSNSLFQVAINLSILLDDLMIITLAKPIPESHLLRAKVTHTKDSDSFPLFLCFLVYLNILRDARDLYS